MVGRIPNGPHRLAEARAHLIREITSHQAKLDRYAALIAAANEIGDAETAAVCEQNMREDEAMAARILAVLPDVVAAHLGSDAAMPAGRAASGERMGHPEPPMVDPPSAGAEA